METTVFNRAKLTIDSLVKQYRARFGDHFSSDKAAELFPEYSASVESRTANRAAVTKASHLVADQAFRARLAEPDSTPVTFVVGGPGAGKTTLSAEAIRQRRIIFAGSAVHAEPLIDEAVASGRKVDIQYIHRDPLDAFRGTLDRAMNSPAERGRVIPLQLHEDLHKGSAEAISRIQDKYANDPNVNTSYLINDSKSPSREGSIEDVRGTRYDELGGQLRDILTHELDIGRISQAVYDRVRQGPGSNQVRETDTAGGDEGTGPGSP